MRYFANFSPRFGRPEFTADADVRAAREKYRLRPLFRSIVHDEWLHVYRRDKRFSRCEKEQKEWRIERKREREQMREKASHRENGTTGRKERVREREKKVERNIRAGEKRGNERGLLAYDGRSSGERLANKGGKRKRRTSRCGGVAAAREHESASARGEENVRLLCV